ncbi:MAG: putative glycoside hydrolase [Pirellulaceae bacterium]
MLNDRILIAGAIAAAIPLMTLVNRTTAEGADETTGKAAVQQGIPLWTNVREPISDDAWRHIASRYSLVFTLFSPTASGKDLTSENERVKWIKSLNPKMPVLVYGSAINAANFRLRTWKKPQEHPDWFLKDEAGKWVTDWEYTSGLHLDPGNREWQEYVATELEKYINRYGYDGVFLDLVDTTPKYVNFKKTLKAVNPKTGKPYSDAEWKQATLEMLRTVRRHIGDKLLITNGARGTYYFRTGYSNFFAFTDGLCNEGFTGWSQGPQPRPISEQDWKADIDELVDCAKRGKIVLAVANAKKREPGESAAEYEELYRYIAASFLLGRGKRHYLMFYAKVWQRPESYGRSGEVLPAFCRVSLGEPRAGYYRRHGVYQRDFQRGKVLVNPTGKAIELPLDGTYNDAEGNVAADPLRMPPRTGAILVHAK